MLSRSSSTLSERYCEFSCLSDLASGDHSTTFLIDSKCRKASVGRSAARPVCYNTWNEEKSMPSVWIAPLTRWFGARTDKVTEGQTIQVSSTWLSHIHFGLAGIRKKFVFLTSVEADEGVKKKNSKQKIYLQSQFQIESETNLFFFFSNSTHDIFSTNFIPIRNSVTDLASRAQKTLQESS